MYPTNVPLREIPTQALYWVFPGYNHHESLENTIDTMGYTVRGTPNCPLICAIPFDLDLWRGPGWVLPTRIRRPKLSPQGFFLGKPGIFGKG